MAVLLPKERLEPIGIENPAPVKLSNGDVLPKLTKGIAVQYESGISTIRISGTPVMKRKQMFERPQTQGESNVSTLNKQNVRPPDPIQNGVIPARPDILNADGTKAGDDSNRAISASIEIMSDIGEPDVNSKADMLTKDINDNEGTKQTLTNRGNSNSLLLQRKSSKKVSFLETVAINKDISTTLSGSDESEEGTPLDITNSRSSLNGAHTKEEVGVILTDSSQPELTKPQALPQANGYATPIVDEFEVRQLSRKLSSRETGNKSPVKTGIKTPPEKGSLNVKDKKQENHVKDSKKVNDKDATKKVKDTGKYKKKLKSNRLCMWLAVVVIILAVAGLMVLGILYAISTSGQSVEEVKSSLTSQLSLTQSSNLFRGGLESSRSNTGLVYILLDSGDHMTWRTPKQPVRLSWHRGTTVQIHSLPVSGGDLSTFHLGDLLEESGSRYSELLTSGSWYTARVQGKDKYCLLSLYNTGNISTVWEEADEESLLTLYPDHSSLIRDNF